jgi:large subunit ribosomal protein L10
VTLRLEDKKAIVAEVSEVAASALAAVTAEYRGLTVTQMTKLREEARKKNVYLRVVRNTLARRAFEGTAFVCLNESLTGPLVIAFSRGEPGAAAKLIRDFAKANEKLVIRSLAFDGQLLAANEIDKLANLPTREEALSQLMAVMQAPVTKLLRTMVEPYAKLTRTVAAVRDQKQAA